MKSSIILSFSYLYSKLPFLAIFFDFSKKGTRNELGCFVLPYHVIILPHRAVARWVWADSSLAEERRLRPGWGAPLGHTRPTCRALGPLGAVASAGLSANFHRVSKKLYSFYFPESESLERVFHSNATELQLLSFLNGSLLIPATLRSFTRPFGAHQSESFKSETGPKTSHLKSPRPFCEV